MRLLLCMLFNDLSLLILCITPSVSSSVNASSILILSIFAITDLNCRSLNFLMITLKRKQLGIIHPSTAKVLPWPRLQRGRFDAPL